MELNQWPALVVGFFDVCWIRLVVSFGGCWINLVVRFGACWVCLVAWFDDGLFSGWVSLVVEFWWWLGFVRGGGGHACGFWF